MESIEFTVMIRPFSVNAYHFRDKRHKTPDARAWEEALIRAIEPYEKRLQELGEDFRTKGGCFHVYYTAIYPSHVFRNKADQISSKTIDVTNFEKPLQDVIFGKIMDVNDKAVIECTSSKEEGPFTALTVKIEYYEYITS